MRVSSGSDQSSHTHRGMSDRPLTTGVLSRPDTDVLFRCTLPPSGALGARSDPFHPLPFLTRRNGSRPSIYDGAVVTRHYTDSYGLTIVVHTTIVNTYVRHGLYCFLIYRTRCDYGSLRHRRAYIYSRSREERGSFSFLLRVNKVTSVFPSIQLTLYHVVGSSHVQWLQLVEE